jgi:transcription initiation factor TFIIIB Brf1 subunit/transcription initiation factor TFIIB
MLKPRQTLQADIKRIEKFDKIYEYHKKKRLIEIPSIKQLSDVSFINKINKTNHHDFQDHDDMDTEFDEIIIPECEDVFDKKEIKMNVSTNVSLINAFPNALLLDESIFCKNENNPKKKSESKKEEKKEKEENLWDFLNQLYKKNDSEQFDLLTTESDTFEDNYPENKKCKACKGALIEDQQASALICSECGMINEELFDHGPEWRQYNNDDNRGEGVNRCGCPSSFFFPKSSQGTIMAGSSNSRLKRKQKWNSMVYKERSLNQVFEFISQICSKNNIPKIIVDDAKIFYKNLSDCKHKNGANTGKQIIIRGDNRISIIAACVFKACEKNKNPRNTREIAEFFGLDEKKVTKGNKQFEKIMKNADDRSVMFDNIVRDNDTAEDWIRRHCPKLKISKENTDIAVKISQNCCKMKLASDHNPQSIAAGSILVMVEYRKLNIDKKNIAKLFKTSDVTISKIYNKIEPFTRALVDDAATEYLINKFKING